MIDNIKYFKKLHYYDETGKELSRKEVEDLDIEYNEYIDLEEAANLLVDELSSRFSDEEEPTWEDVEEAYIRGVFDGIKYSGYKTNAAN